MSQAPRPKKHRVTSVGNAMSGIGFSSAAAAPGAGASDMGPARRAVFDEFASPPFIPERQASQIQRPARGRKFRVGLAGAPVSAAQQARGFVDNGKFASPPFIPYGRIGTSRIMQAPGQQVSRRMARRRVSLNDLE